MWSMSVNSHLCKEQVQMSYGRKESGVAAKGGGGRPTQIKNILWASDRSMQISQRISATLAAHFYHIYQSQI
jgi:hypothetical protein